MFIHIIIYVPPFYKVTTKSTTQFTHFGYVKLNINLLQIISIAFSISKA